MHQCRSLIWDFSAVDQSAIAGADTQHGREDSAADCGNETWPSQENRLMRKSSGTSRSTPAPVFSSDPSDCLGQKLTTATFTCVLSIAQTVARSLGGAGPGCMGHPALRLHACPELEWRFREFRKFRRRQLLPVQGSTRPSTVHTKTHPYRLKRDKRGSSTGSSWRTSSTSCWCALDSTIVSPSLSGIDVNDV